MKTLITGASGHLGANLTRRVLYDNQRHYNKHNNEQVSVLLRKESNNAALDGLDVERVYGDLRDVDALRKAVQGCDRIYHCAAQVSTLAGSDRFKQNIYENNVVGTINLLKAALAENVSKVVVTGSFSATGHDPAGISDETAPFNPFGTHLSYGFTKACVEHECLKAFADGLDVVVAVSCAILGPHDYKPSRMGRTLIDFANGQLPAYTPGGFDFVAANDIVEGHVLAMEKGRPGQKYIFSTQFQTLDDLMVHFEAVTQRPRPRLRLPAAVMAAIAQVADTVLPIVKPDLPRRFTSGAVRILRMHRRACCDKAIAELGYQPTSVRYAIQAAYDDFVQRGLIVPGDDAKTAAKNDELKDSQSSESVNPGAIAYTAGLEE